MAPRSPRAVWAACAQRPCLWPSRGWSVISHRWCALLRSRCDLKPHRLPTSPAATCCPGLPAAPPRAQLRGDRRILRFHAPHRSRTSSSSATGHLLAAAPSLRAASLQARLWCTRPATFSHPTFSLIGDFALLGLKATQRRHLQRGRSAEHGATLLSIGSLLTGRLPLNATSPAG